MCGYDEMSLMEICTRCIYDQLVPGIRFDEHGVCNYCHQIDDLKSQYGTGSSLGEQKFDQIISTVREAGRGQRYDCVVGVSGGTDSSYLLHHLVNKYQLRVLAVHYDNTWNTAFATTNIASIVSVLDVDLVTHVTSNHEVDDIIRSFFFAGVAELDAATDLGFTYLLRRVAARHGIRYAFEGHSFVEEGITPLSRNYFDGRYIKSIHERFGTMPMKTYPLMTLTRFLRSTLLSPVQFIRPLWYLPYSKREAKQLLMSRYKWQDYGGHHLENRAAAFQHVVYLPEKFGVDLRNNSIAAQVRQGYISRDSGIEIYRQPPQGEHGLAEYFRRRLQISEGLYQQVMEQIPLSWTDYPTYKRHFEILEPLFRKLVKDNKVPMSFYMKYCRK